jgi:hypothetical protein
VRHFQVHKVFDKYYADALLVEPVHAKVNTVLHIKSTEKQHVYINSTAKHLVMNAFDVISCGCNAKQLTLPVY